MKLLLSLDANRPNHIVIDNFLGYDATDSIDMKKFVAVIARHAVSATSDFEFPAEFGWTLPTTPDETIDNFIAQFIRDGEFVLD